MKKTSIGALFLAAALAFSPVTALASQDGNRIILPSNGEGFQWTTDSINTQNASVYTQEWENTIPANDIRKFVIDNEVGNIHIEAYDEKDIKVKAELRLTGYNSDITKDILDKSALNYTVKDNVVTLGTIEKGSSSPMYQWLRDNYNATHYNLSVNYTVYINKDSSLIYEIEQLVGDISIKGLKGNFNLVSEVGNLSVSAPSVSGENTVKTAVGYVNMDFDSINDAQKITGEAEVGNVNISFNKDADYTLTKSSIFRKAETVKNGTGKTDINLSADVGYTSYTTK